MLRDGSLAQVALDSKAKDYLSDKFDKLGKGFLNEDTEVHDYAPAFTPEDGGLLKLKYELPKNLLDCRRQLPSGVPELRPDVLAGQGVKALVAIDTGTQPRFLFQVIDNRTLVRPSSVVLFFRKSFTLNDSVGIAFPDRLDALSAEGDLYFRSELVVRRFLDIEKYFAEATDSDIDSFFTTKAFNPADTTQIKTLANDRIRRKLHGIIASKRDVNPSAVEKVGKAVGVEVKMKGGKLIIPTTLPEFRALVSILDDAFLESMLDRRSVYLTTSKRRVPHAAGK
jgi:hypothetical protein